MFLKTFQYFVFKMPQTLRSVLTFAESEETSVFFICQSRQSRASFQTLNNKEELRKTYV